MSDTTISGASYFVPGGTVPPGAPSYVERATDRELLQALLAGEYAYVLNSRQMGKSSLAVRTIGSLGNAEVRTAFVDLTKLGTTGVSEEQWYAGLLAEIARGLGLRSQLAAHLKENAALSPVQRLIAFLQDVVARLGVPVVVIVDEVDAVRSLGFSTDSFFAGIRQCWNGRSTEPHLRSLTFCLMGAALPGDLIRDVRVTPFNVGRRIELRDFTREEAAALAPGLGAQGLAKAQRVWDWTGGHPYLTQSLCAGLATSSTTVDALVRERYFDARARDADANLADVANRLLGRGESDEIRAQVLSTYERMLKGKPVSDDEANPAAARIKMSGIARVENGLLKPRNRIYAEVFGIAWIRENMPDHELRRQRRAFRKGVARASAVAGLAIASIGTLAAVAVRNAAQAREAERKAIASESRAKLSELQAKASESRAKASEADAIRSASEATRLAKSEALAKKGAQRSAAEAVAAKLVAQHNLVLARNAQRQASLAADAERVQKVEAQRLALAEKVARKEASAQAEIAKRNEFVAVKSEKEARRLLYATNMNLTAQMLDHGSGVQMAEYLAAAHPKGGPAAGGWESRHFEARLHEAHELQATGDRIMKVAFSPQGHLLANDLTMRVSIWDPNTGKIVVRRQPTDIAGGVSAGMSGFDGTIALSKSNGSIEVRSPEDYSLLKTIPGKGSPIELVDLPLAPGLMTGWLGPKWTIVDLRTGEFSAPMGGEGYVPSPAMVLPNKDLLHTRDYKIVRTVTVGEPGTVRWDNPARFNTLKTSAVSADGRLVAYADWTGHVQILDGTTGTPIGPTVVHDAPVITMAFNSEGTEYATGAVDGVVAIYRVADGTAVRTFHSHLPDVSCLAFSVKGDRLAFGTAAGRVGFYDLGSFEGPAASLYLGGDWMGSVAVSPDGKILAAETTGDQAVRLFDAHSGSPIATLPAGPQRMTVRFSPDGKWLGATGLPEAGGKTSLLRLWNAQTHALRTIPIDLMSTAKLNFSPDSRSVLITHGEVTNFSNSVDSAARLYDIASGKPFGATPKGSGYIYSASFSPDGKRIGMAWEGGKIAVFDAHGLKEIATTTVATNVSGGDDPYAAVPLATAFTPDGSLFLVGRASGEVGVYDAKTLRQMGIWSAHTGRVLGLTFTRDGRTLITSSDDRRVRMWENGTWQGLGEVTLPAAIYPMAYSAAGDEVFAGAFDGNVYALRASVLVEPKPAAPAPAGKLRAWEDALAESRRSGKPIFFPFFTGWNYTDRSLRTFLMDPENARIVGQYFTLFDPWQSEIVSYGGKPTAVSDLYKAVGPKLGQGYAFFSGNDQLLYDGMGDAESGHSGMALGSPQADWEIESFLRAFRRIAPTVTDGELGTMRRYMTLSARPTIDAIAWAAAFNALDTKRTEAVAARRYDDALVLTDQMAAMAPTEDSRRLQAADAAARAERWSEAAHRYRQTIGDLRGIESSQGVAEQFARAMAGDKASYQANMRLPSGGATDYFANYTLREECLSLGLIEGASENLPFEASRIAKEYALELLAPQNAPQRLRYALVLLRAGKGREAEDLARKTMAEPIWALQNAYWQKLDHAILAVILARNGDLDGARSELVIAESAFDRRYTDGELVGGGIAKFGGIAADQTETGEYAVHRREVETLLGMRKP